MDERESRRRRDSQRKDHNGGSSLEEILRRQDQRDVFRPASGRLHSEQKRSAVTLYD